MIYRSSESKRNKRLKAKLAKTQKSFNVQLVRWEAIVQQLQQQRHVKDQELRDTNESV